MFNMSNKSGILKRSCIFLFNIQVGLIINVFNIRITKGAVKFF